MLVRALELAQLAGARVFTKLDANSGFWQIPLAKESALLTTFIIPFGRSCFNRLPFGITSAPEHFQRRMADVLCDLEGAVCLMDDILVHGKSQEEHDRRLMDVLQRLQYAGLTLNEKKCEFSKSRVKFVGQIVDHKGVRPDPNKIAAIKNMRTPNCVGDICRLLGMTNQLSKFSIHLADETKPLRDLLSNKNQRCWEQPQEKAFEEVKEEISRSPTLALFDPTCETVVAADASSYGLGAVLLQKQDDGERRPIAYVSLAITWACDRFADILIGLKFHIETDHKPLAPLLSTKRLDELPLRVQRFRMRLMWFQFSISHVPGKSLTTADALSRAPAPDTLSEEDGVLGEEVKAYVNEIIQSIPATERRLEEIKMHQGEDEIFQQITEYC